MSTAVLSGKQLATLKKASLNGGVKLDLACGQNKREGFIGVDIVKTPQAEIACDLLKFPWPFDSGSVAETHLSHFFEHIPGKLRFRFMDELWRVTVPEGKSTIICPYYSSARAIQDPTHEWPPISEWSFLYFNRKWRVDNKLDHYPVRCDWDFTYGYVMNPQWAVRSEEARTFAVQNYINVVADIQAVLVKRKDG